MEDQVKVKSFEKLRSMRDALCEREKTRKEKVQHQKWLLEQMQELKKISECQDCTIEIIKTIIQRIPGQSTEAGLLLSLLAIPTLTIAFCIFGALILKRFIPKLYNILNGQRS